MDGEKKLNRTAQDVEQDLRKYTRQLVDQAERDGLLRSFEPQPGSDYVPTIERLFEGKYIIGTWRRSPYRPAAFPLALMGSMTSMSVTLGTFDQSCVVWRFTLKSPPVDEAFIATMECHELGEKPHGLTADLDLVSDTSRSLEWLVQAYEPFRGDSLDIAVTIRSSIDGRFLCSNESTKKVALLTKHDADIRDAVGNFVWNIAWECSPELSPATGGDLDFLDKYLTETNTDMGMDLL
uniref:Uncharacterized protein n=1 Tax=Octactis speculum TaxID=3111310 RepID=A0A7S2BLF7_9STRA|mmetsp:Transcript_24575/g.33659  ORF Transcript_24575/g.33659 Transcript_24575/m.33659 type:complete len:237 (+) Transcript_24575:54-764(+)